MPTRKRQINVAGRAETHARKSNATTKRDALERNVSLLKNVARVADPRKHPEFKELNYTRLKRLGLSLEVLHQKFHLRIGDLYRIKVPVNELIKEFGLKDILKYTEFAAPFREVIPMKELRKAGVKAKELIKLKVPYGALYHYGNYTLKELAQAGVPIEKIKRLGPKGHPLKKAPKKRRI